MQATQSSRPTRSRRQFEIVLAFLRLGFIAFGGPSAHIALMEEEFVRRREWVSRERFLDFLGAASLLPGPSSTELAIYLGEWRGGIAGLMAAGAAFILPSAFLVAVLAWAYVRFGGVPHVAGLLLGVKPVVVAIVAQAIWSLGRSALKSWGLAAVAAVTAVLAALRVSTVALLLGAGAAWILLRAAQTPVRERRSSAMPLLQTASFAAAGAGAGVAAIFFYFLKVGAVLFGSGYVLLAFLRADLVVGRHWLTDGQLLDAIAVSQATPGPFFTVATFIGYLLGGWKGGVVATAGMFCPAFLYVAVTARFLPKLRQSWAAGAFLDGVNAAAVALMAVVGAQFARSALVSPPAIVLAVASGVLLFRRRVNSAWLVAGGAAAGLLQSFLGWK